ncbi:MAG: 2-O-(6-phospho-alpha-D-mannosyl)-D-glycerate hydrolase [Frankiales bacterium]|nr:2-O-(6-phospho-alpha-D-mannosyl)-D-glycerate hydrolase [Frankiales bacterium]
MGDVDAVLVSHTHWDREWYRTFQAFRSRLVDAVDRVLDLIAADPGYHFLLDGQAVVLEDYLVIRPHRRGELEAGCAEGRLGIGPWYVQPDMLLPSGEAHVRNLLEGRRVAGQIGPVSRVGYAPDSFGHPAQLPQLLAGFGLTTFVYWRGNGSEIDRLPMRYSWVAPDGTTVVAHHLRGSYSGGGSLPVDMADAVDKLVQVGEKQLDDGTGRVLLMNGDDHTLPDPRTGEIASALAEATGWTVRRGLLDEAVIREDNGLPTYAGELLGGRVANLLPGVWSTRTYLKQRNRLCEAALEGWAEPWAAFASALGLRDERPALRTAWRALLLNQAHDSICGCSADAVHEQMQSRYDEAGELASETTHRILDRIAGLGPERRTPWRNDVDVAVFNPSPFPVTDVVRIPVDGFPPVVTSRHEVGIHPLVALSMRPGVGIAVHGVPARVIPGEGERRFRLIPEHDVWETEVVATDVPAFGWKRLRLTPGEPTTDAVDDGRQIGVEGVSVRVEDDGTLAVRIGVASWSGLCAIEDLGDRGDTYDFDPVPDDSGAVTRLLGVRRERHPTGIQRLYVELAVDVPRGLNDDRSHRSEERVTVPMTLIARVAPGVPRVDVDVRGDNTATDHRLRLMFPTGSGAGRCRAGTTFGVADRRSGHVDDTGWQHAAPTTWPHQGWLAAGGLALSAPGLPEGEVSDSGSLAVTVLRAVGWLSRYGLATRPDPAGPGIPTPGAQCPGPFTAHFSLFAADARTPAYARSVELGLRAVIGGDTPLIDDGRALLRLSPDVLALSALKPADDGDGVIARILNPTDREVDAELTFGVPVASVSNVRLDEEPVDGPVTLDADTVRLAVPRHALRSLRVHWA